MHSEIIILLIAGLIFVPVFKRLGAGSVLGYLVAGIVIGPWGLGLITSTEQIVHTAELGVLFLLFVIGLELQPSRLWVLRRSILGLGIAQVSITTALIGLVVLMLGFELKIAVLMGLALAMSSTAFVIQSLSERDELTAQHGRDAFSILLFQDIAVIPILALLPLLGEQLETPPVGAETPSWWAIPAVIGFIILTRYLTRPLLRVMADLDNRELFTAVSLLIVVGTAYMMLQLRLSMALGAFLAGVILADSEYRHELQADIEPFKGLFLGLFFISVGLLLNASVFLYQPHWMIALVLALCAIKAAAISLMSLVRKVPRRSSVQLALGMAQGGEFAFVLSAAALSLNLLDQKTADYMNAVVTGSMLISPVLILSGRKLFNRLDRQSIPDDPKYDPITITEEHPVVIAGFGRFGQIVARVLQTRNIKFTALEKSAEQVNFVRNFGNKIYYGDASRLDLLRAAGVAHAKLFVLAIDDVESSIRTAQLVKKYFPQVQIYARVRNRFHAYRMMDLKVEYLVRETYFSSLLASGKVLTALGLDEDQARRTTEAFQKYDEDLLLKQHAVYQDEAQLVQTGRQSQNELRNLFATDHTRRYAVPAGSGDAL